MSGGFEALVSAIPDLRVSVEVLVREAGMEADAADRVRDNGVERVPVETGPPGTLIGEVLSRLAAAVPALEARAHGVLFAQSLPVPTALLAHALDGAGLQDVPFAVLSGQPCAILHTGVRLAQAWLREAPEGAGIVLVGADQAPSADARLFFNSAMGDAAVAGFLTRDSARHRVTGSFCETVLVACEGEHSPADDIARFRAENPTSIRRAVDQCLSGAGLTLEDLAFIVPHTPNGQIWDAVAALLRFPRERVLTIYMHETGHLNSNDSFVHYVRAVEEERIRPGDRVLLVNPGFGGTRGCTLIEF